MKHKNRDGATRIQNIWYSALELDTAFEALNTHLQPRGTTASWRGHVLVRRGKREEMFHFVESQTKLRSCVASFASLSILTCTWSFCALTCSSFTHSYAWLGCHKNLSKTIGIHYLGRQVLPFPGTASTVGGAEVNGGGMDGERLREWYGSSEFLYRHLLVKCASVL